MLSHSVVLSHVEGIIHESGHIHTTLLFNLLQIWKFFLIRRIDQE